MTEGQPATFTVRANPAPAANVQVSVTVTETGDTLAASVPDNVTVSAGQTTATLQVTTDDDTADESQQHRDRKGEPRHRRLHGRPSQLGQGNRCRQ